MDEMARLYLGTPILSLTYLQLVLGSIVVCLITVYCIIKVLREDEKISRIIFAVFILTVLMIVLRKFLPSPNNMLVFHILTLFIIALIFRIPLKKSVVGVVFSLLLSMLSSATVTMNLLLYTNISKATQHNIGLFLFMSLTEVFFNLVYVLLAARYKKLNLSFLFSEEENAKA